VRKLSLRLIEGNWRSKVVMSSVEVRSCMLFVLCFVVRCDIR
jgi:hypothetical protein